MSDTFLQSFDKFDEILDISSEQRILKQKDIDVKLKGWFKYVDEHLTYIYHDEDSFYVYLNSNRYLLRDDFFAVVDISEKVRIFKLYQGSESIAIFFYINPSEANDDIFL